MTLHEKGLFDWDDPVELMALDSECTGEARETSRDGVEADASSPGTDPGTGIMRHVDAGYEKARKVAKEQNVNVGIVEGL